MVGSAIHGADSVETGGDIAQIGSEFTVDGGTVDSLEEAKRRTVQNFCGGERLNLLHRHMGMANELSLSVDLTGGHVVGLLRLGERAGLHFIDLHLHNEVGARGNGSKVLGEGDLD